MVTQFVRIPFLLLACICLLNPLNVSGQYLEQKITDYPFGPKVEGLLANYPETREPIVGPANTRHEAAVSIDISDFHYVPPENDKDAGSGSGLINAIRTKPGIALLSSAVLPGSGQLINNKYIRGALYIAVEATALYLHLSKQQTARDQQDHYQQFANNNWSVVNYAQWLVQYYDNNEEISGGQALEDLRAQVGNITDIPYGKNAWDDVSHSTLNRVERQTPFIYTSGRVGNSFSHTLPEYGSQQYYELISKYYQFGPGWSDFGQTRDGPLNSLYQLQWNGSDMSPNFHEGAQLAARFNDSYRVANNMLKLMVVNHVISAFDSYFTVKLKQHKLEADATLLKGGGSLLTLNYHF